MPIQINLTVDQAIAEAKVEAKERIASTRQECRDNIKKIRRGAKQIGKLSVALPAEANCQITSYWGYYGPLVEFDRKYLGVIRKAVGHLAVDCKALANAEQRLIRVTLKAEKFPAVRFSYLRTLPPSNAEPGEMVCEIVEVVQEARTYKTLACHRKPAAVVPALQAAVTAESEPQLERIAS